MILYTIYDPEFVFNTPENNVSYSEMSVDGVTVQISLINNEDCRVERIISTNPTDYLNPRLQPGSIIKK